MSAPRLLVLPPVPALLGRYASLADPVGELRAACRSAVGWLLEPAPEVVAVLGDPADVQRGVAQELLGGAGYAGSVVHGPGAAAQAVVVLANGSARRGEKAPGHLDERSFAFDEALGRALRTGEGLDALDVELADRLLASGVRTLRELAGPPPEETVVTYDDDPYGVQYWVVRWVLGAPGPA